MRTGKPSLTLSLGDSRASHVVCGEAVRHGIRVCGQGRARGRDRAGRVVEVKLGEGADVWGRKDEFE